MKFKRLLTIALMALFGAGTATAASQLNSLQVTPKGNTAMVNLQTTGSFAHKEYRPNEHLVLVDLTGVTADAAIERTAALSSAVLKSYKLSSYTSASGSEVTRIELVLGDGVSVAVSDKSEGLQVLLSSAGSNATAPPSLAPPIVVNSSRSTSAGSTPVAPKPAGFDAAAPPRPASVAPVTSVASSFPSTSASAETKAVTPKSLETVKPSRKASEYAAVTAKSTGTQLTPQVVPTRPAVLGAVGGALTTTTIRSVSVQRGHGTLDIIIEGPDAARPYLLKNPDRLVLDFSNAVMRPSVRNIVVHTKDVLQVRVGRFQAEPPVIRVVIDLSGPRTFDVLPSAKQVIVRVKTDEAGMLMPPFKAAPPPVLASVEIPAVTGWSNSVSTSVPNIQAAHAALVSASPKPRTEAVVLPVVSVRKAAPPPVLASVEIPAVAGRTNPVSTSVPNIQSAHAVLVSASAKPRTEAVVLPVASVRKATPTPVLAPVEVPAVAVRINPVGSIVPSSQAAHAALVSASPKPRTEAVILPVVSVRKAAPTPVLASVEVPAVAVRINPVGPTVPNIQAAHAAPVSASPEPRREAVVLPVPSVRKANPTPVLASLEVPVLAERINQDSSSVSTDQDAHAAVVSASPQPKPEAVALHPAKSIPQLRSEPIRDPKVRAGAAADTIATSPQVGQPAIEAARLNHSAPEPLPGNAAMASTSAPRYTGEPISVNLKDVDLKDFFRLIHEISGLNIVLDPNVKGAVTLVLDDVPWDQALDIVLKNNSLDRELQGNVLRIAATDTLRREAVDRRAQSEAVALAVDRQTISRFLSYAKAKDVMPTIKKFLTARGDVISDDRTNALIISDIPSVIPNLDRLISQLDRKSQEVEIELRVVSATRSFSRDLGFQLGFNWGNGVSTISGSNPNGGTITTPAGTVSTVPLFSNLPATGATTGLSLSNITKMYGIDAILTAAEAHNLAKVLSRPRVVTQSNVKAEVKQGVKLPVLTAATANANASVTYIDSVLRLSVTPQITSDNTIFLTVDVENTQPSGLLNANYILTTQQATTQVLVTDGGTVVIGGVIQTTNSVSTSQTPVLGDIPWLGNLFKQRLVKTETDELIFFITPKIIQT